MGFLAPALAALPFIGAAGGATAAGAGAAALGATAIAAPIAAPAFLGVGASVLPAFMGIGGAAATGGGLASSILGGLSIAMPLVQGGLSFLSQSQQNRAAQDAANLNASQARLNQARAGANTAQDASSRYREQRLSTGKNIARGGVSGLESSGSISDVLADNNTQNSMDINYLLEAGRSQQFDYGIQSRQATANVPRGSGIGAVLSGVGGAISAATTMRAQNFNQNQYLNNIAYQRGLLG